VISNYKYVGYFVTTSKKKIPEIFVLILGIVSGEKAKHLTEMGWAN
jgi:hypothetical protein